MLTHVIVIALTAPRAVVCIVEWFCTSSNCNLGLLSTIRKLANHSPDLAYQFCREKAPQP